MGLHVLCCFSTERLTLTADEISELLDLPEKDVTRHAARLAGLGYLDLEAGPSSGASAWTLMPDE
jgi:DNA-binding IclR family transcriptional regulator